MPGDPHRSQHDAGAPNPRPSRPNLEGAPRPPAAPASPVAAVVGALGAGESLGRPVAAAVAGAFVRNKAEQERTFRELRELQRRLEWGEPSIGEVVSGIEDIVRQNESTIRRLQRQLMDVTRERDDARRDAERLERDLREERVGFASVSHKHKKEIQKWKRAAKELRDKTRRMKERLQRQERVRDKRKRMKVRLKKQERAIISQGGAVKGDTTAARALAEDAAGHEDPRSASDAIATPLSEGEKRREKYAEVVDDVGRASDVEAEDLEEPRTSSDAAALDTPPTREADCRWDGHGRATGIDEDGLAETFGELWTGEPAASTSAPPTSGLRCALICAI